MNIAVIRSSYSPHGGVEVLTLQLVNALLQRGCHISLLTWPEQQWPIASPRLQVISLGSPRGNRLWQTWFFEKRVAAYLASRRFHAIFALDRVSTCTHFHAGGGSHRAFLNQKNSLSSPPARLFRKISLFHNYVLFLEKKTFENRMLSKVHCCSRMVATDLLAHYPHLENRLYLAYNGINWKEIGLSFAKRRELNSRLRAAYGLRQENRYLFFLGSGFERKGLDLALRGLAYLPQDFHLIVAGKGRHSQYRKLAERLGLAKRVVFLGPVENGWQLAACSEAFVLPSRYEPFGLAAAEAQAMGLPVLVSERTGFAELVQAGQNGVILEEMEREDSIRQTFGRLQRLIVRPAMAPEAIREHVRCLDNELIMGQMVDQFLLGG